MKGSVFFSVSGAGISFCFNTKKQLKNLQNTMQEYILPRYIVEKKESSGEPHSIDRYNC